METLHIVLLAVAVVVLLVLVYYFVFYKAPPKVMQLVIGPNSRAAADDIVAKDGRQYPTPAELTKFVLENRPLIDAQVGGDSSKLDVWAPVAGDWVQIGDVPMHKFGKLHSATGAQPNWPATGATWKAVLILI